ncbi:hypothetical protein SK128_019408 [Halocaridina rubra]|uniref:Copper homeostasis protein cutC homolog n=1 Tax=Halocaridina rubra TaxID=373956 RepID=A0AAN8XFR0_HALRR
MLEICVDSVASAMAAVDGGADRLELCAALSEGGLTPTVGLLSAVKIFISRPVDMYCMIRPRGGPMVYSKEEEEIIMRDIDSLKMAGADGLVFGALNEDGTINEQLCRAVKKAAGGLPCTFHRAFDLLPDLLTGLETVKTLQYERLLTSGGKASALEGSEILSKLVSASNGQIIVMAGAGIKSNNASSILAQTGVQECHASARVKRVLGSDDGNRPKMGQGSDNVMWVTCTEEVKKIKQALCS